MSVQSAVWYKAKSDYYAFRAVFRLFIYEIRTRLERVRGRDSLSLNFMLLVAPAPAPARMQELKSEVGGLAGGARCSEAQ